MIISILPQSNSIVEFVVIVLVLFFLISLACEQLSCIFDSPVHGLCYPIYNECGYWCCLHLQSFGECSPIRLLAQELEHGLLQVESNPDVSAMVPDHPLPDISSPLENVVGLLWKFLQNCFPSQSAVVRILNQLVATADMHIPANMDQWFAKRNDITPQVRLLLMPSAES